MTDQSGIASKIQKLVWQAGREFVKGLKLSEVRLEHPENPGHGDYSTNVALVLAKMARKKPLDLAKLIVKKLPKADFIEKVEVAKPGFINFWLVKEWLGKQIELVLKEKDRYGSSRIGEGKTVIIDYSSPNIAKPFGIGHLRSTIIGQAIYNIYKFLGWKTIGDNHLGDWGTQFGKLIVAIKKWSEAKGEKLRIKNLEKLYVKFHQEAAKNPNLEDKARVWFKLLEDGDREARKIWKTCVETSMKEFDRIYDLLGVKIDVALGESFYEDKMPAVIEQAKRKRVAVKSRGAFVIKFPEMGIPPAIIVKSDGATTYVTRDLACIAYRKKRWQPDLYIYEVGAEQKLHFQQTFAAAVKFGFGQPEQFVHVAHGLIRLPTGKISTRKGKTIHLEEVLEEAVKRAKKIIKSSLTDRNLGKREQEEVAQAVGVGAVKYFDLMHHYSTDFVFDWKKAFLLEGNSAPYLQYTYARAKSVLRKSRFKHPVLVGLKHRVNEEEMAILRTVYQFLEVVLEAGERYSPNLVCQFLFDLAQKFNLFYDRHRIIGSNEEKFRLALTAATAQVLENGLNLLGIKVLERM